MVENDHGQPHQKWSFEKFLRTTFKPILDGIAGFLGKLGITPNMITVFGLLISAAAAFLVATGKLTAGGLVLLFGALMDALDGSLARLSNSTTKFGAFLDSVTDRVSELVIFGGLIYYYAQQADTLAVMLVFIAAAGSVLVSYVKARAESLGFTAKMGLLTRVERMIILIPCLIFNIPLVSVWILAILTNVTAIQRFVFVRSQSLKPPEV